MIFKCGFYFLFLISTSALAAPTINIGRLLDHLGELKAVGKNATGGTSRLAYSESDKRARYFAMEWMLNAGLTVTIDPAGNIVGKKKGRKDFKPIVSGSHLDTVPDGGNFDGIVGVLSAIESAHALTEAKVQLDHPLEIIILQNEEGGHLGSRAITSGLSPDDLALKSLSGKTVSDGIKFIGGDLVALEKYRKKSGDLAAFLELHIEQGEVLEREKRQIGIVKGIVGISRWTVTVEGFANHAGTTPMKYRRDALVAASKLIDSLYEEVRKIPGDHVATVGTIEVLPGAPNVIPGKAIFTLEIRDLEQSKIERVAKLIKNRAEVIAKKTKTKFDFKPSYQTLPVPTDKAMQTRIETEAKKLGLSFMPLPSGAGHDAQEFGRLAPMGMIFIPSKDGISHSPLESSNNDDIRNGAQVLLNVILAMDR